VVVGVSMMIVIPASHVQILKFAKSPAFLRAKFKKKKFCCSMRLTILHCSTAQHHCLLYSALNRVIPCVGSKPSGKPQLFAGVVLNEVYLLK
jgi:hypothetical protein